MSIEDEGRVVVIHQPDFAPYIGFFHKIYLADIFVVLDDVQFLRGSKRWHNRDKIKTSKGEEWLTVNVEKTSQDAKINEIRLCQDERWKKKHLSIIKHNYSRSDYFREIFNRIEEIYEKDYVYLIDFNLAFIELFMELFDVKRDIYMSSRFNLSTVSNQRLADLAKCVGATSYLSGVGAKDYFKPEPFEREKINVCWHNFIHPIYKQLYDGFIPYLSVIDLFMNCGIKESRIILRNI